MLDVHPPHAPTHTWKDFFIHIATIVVGLLIAVGLEQTVEYIHRRHQVKELREALNAEREENRQIYALNVAWFRYDRAILKNSLRILFYLKQHPGTPEEKLPGAPVWRQAYDPVVDSAYRNAQQGETLAMLPQQEAAELSHLYQEFTFSQEAAQTAAEAGLKWGEFATIDPDVSHLSAAQVDKDIELLTDALFLNAKWSIWLHNIGEDHVDFVGCPTRAEFEEAVGWSRSPQDRKKLAPAQAQTDEALRSTRAAVEALKPAVAAAH